MKTHTLILHFDSKGKGSEQFNRPTEWPITVYHISVRAGFRLEGAPGQTKLWGAQYYSVYNFYGSDQAEFRSN